MDKTVSFYENMAWDYTIRNDDNTITELRMDLFDLLHTNVENFEHYLIEHSASSSQDSEMPTSLSLSRKRTTADISSSSPLSPRDSKHCLMPLSPAKAASSPYYAKRLHTSLSK